jgi:ElaB/YqjD/DUF883 family membrane-anchored ribosome-binding protein
MSSTQQSEDEHENRSSNGVDLDALQAHADALRAELADVDRRLRGLVREKPLVAVGLAMAAGFLLGRILRRL